MALPHLTPAEINRRPLFPPLLLLIGLILLDALGLSDAPLLFLLALVTSTVYLVLVGLRKIPPSKTMVCLLILFVVGECSLMVWHGQSPPVDPLLFKSAHLYEGVVIDEPEIKEDKIKVKVRLERILDATPTHTDGIILLTYLGSSPSLKPGDLVQWNSKIKPPHGYKNPGVFNYARYLQFNGIKATAFINDPGLMVVTHRGQSSWWRKASDGIKERINEHLSHNQKRGSKTAVQPQVGDEQKSLVVSEISRAHGVLIALLWGDESGIWEKDWKLFRDFGLSHLLVISGMHFGVVAFFLFYAVIFLFRFFPRSFLYLPVRKISASVTLVFLTLYYFFCVQSPSLTRGYLAASCYLIILLIDRPKDLLNILCLAAMAILIWSPYDLFGLSFQFSFVAVLSLFFIYPRLKKGVSKIIPGIVAQGDKKKSVKKIFLEGGLELILANVSISIGLSPLLIFYFHEYPLLSLLMNLWATPVVELLIVPLGLIGLVLEIVFPFIPPLTLHLSLKLLDGVLFILQKSQSLFPSPILVFPPHGWELFFYYLLLLALFLKIPPPIKKGVLWMVLIIFFVDALLFVHSSTYSNKVKITQIDVGQGDSLLIELPGAKRFLIDGGGSPYFDIGNEVLIPFLLEKRIPKLHAVCITHADTDHYLGLKTVLDRYPVEKLLWNGVMDETPEYQRLFKIAEAKKIPVFKVERGDNLFKLNPPSGANYSLQVLSPGPEEREGVKDNNRSIVLRLSAYGFSAILTGDLEDLGEKRLINHYGSTGLLKGDYLKVGHHGSRTSSSADFLKAVGPKLATVGVGAQNRFRHPNAQVMARFSAMGIPVYRTDVNGAIEVEFTEKGLKARPYIVVPP